jgi:hypothetical protein
MNKLLLTLTFCLSVFLARGQDAVVKGRVISGETGTPLTGVSVIVAKTTIQTLTDGTGTFTLTLEAGKTYQISFILSSYLPLEQTVTLVSPSTDLQDIKLERSPMMLQEIPTISINDSDSETGVESQTIQGLLSSSNDIFTSTAAYTFGSARFRIRGYDASMSSVLINGFMANEVESGSPYWSNWGGLNDVMRNTVSSSDPYPTGYMFEPVGGITNIITRASEQRKTIRASYALSNRTYRNRFMTTYNTGLMKNNWAFSGSYSYRWSQEGYVEGTFYKAHSFFLGAEKKINNQHSLSLTALSAIYERGMDGAATQEVYDLAGTNYYNPYWGYQNGEKRNARVRHGNRPLVVLSHYWTPSEKTKINTNIGAWVGTGGATALNWQEVADPRPDYYRYLPSYFADASDKNRIANDWKNNSRVSQLDWDHFYFANRKNLYNIYNVNGTPGNTVTGNRSKYIVEDRRNDVQQLQINTHINHKLSPSVTLTGGFNANSYDGKNYAMVDDLLGGDFWLDIDQFAERDFPGNTNAYQNDMRYPNRLVKEGDTYGYSYTARHRSAGAWAMAKYSGKKYDVFVGGNVNYTSFWRQGHMQKGLFANSSFGDSEKQNFTTYGAKIDGEYRITGRHIVRANLYAATRPPVFYNAFISPRTRNDVVPGLKEESIYSADLTYVLRLPFITSRLSGYFTRVNDQMDVMSFYHEEYRTLVNYSMSDINKEYKGIEWGADIKVTSELSVNTAAAIGRYLYKGEPTVIVTKDNNQEILQTDKVWANNFRLNGTPMTALTLGFKYNSSKFWWAGMNGSYFDDIYIDFNPVTRGGDGSNWSEPQQQPDGFVVDAFLGKSWKINNYYISLSANLSNITNNTSLKTGGFEQLRFNEAKPYQFPPKYYYMYGFNYFINLSIRM